MQTNGQRREEAREKRARERVALREGARLMDVRALEVESGGTISKFTWRSWIQAKRIPYVKLGRRTLVERETFEAIIRAGRVEAR